MGTPSAMLHPAGDKEGDNRRCVARSAPPASVGRAPACRVVSVRTLPFCTATKWRCCDHRALQWKRWPCVLALFCLLGLPMTPRPLLYTPWSRFTAYRTSDRTSDSACGFAVTWAVQASEQTLKQSGEEAYESPASKQEEVADVFNRLSHLRLPEGLIEGLQSVDWGALISTGAAGLEVAVSEGRQFAKELMQSGQVQHILRTLQVEKVEEGLQSLVEELGFKEKLPAQLLRERRTLEISFVPIFVFARERVLERSRDEEEAALKVALGDHQLKAVVKHFENVPPARSMSIAPSTLDGMYENLVKVTTVLMKSRPVALSLALRVELLTREFVEYCRAVFSAVTRYISFVNRFHNNRRALFFFAQHTLPRVIKILLLLNRLEDHLLYRARSEFAENAQHSGALQKEARQLSAHTTDLVSFLGSIAHGCLAATSPQFQVDFARALSAYDHGEDPTTAFESFVEIPKDLLQQAESLPQGRQQEHGHVCGKLLRGTRPQTTKQQGSRRRRPDAESPDRRGNAGSEETEQGNGEPWGKEEKRQDISGLEATEYNEMMRAHLNELREARRSYTGETTATPHIKQAQVAAVRGILSGDHGDLPETPLQASRAATDAGALGAGVPLEAFLTSPPRLFIVPSAATGETKAAAARSSTYTYPAGPTVDATSVAAPPLNAAPVDGATGSAHADTGGQTVAHGADVTEPRDD